MDISPELKRVLNTLALVGTDLKPLFKRLMVAIAAETKKRFATSTAPDGTSWRPLVFRKGKPLWDRGLMMKSVTQLQAPDGIREISNMGLVFGTRTENADIHNQAPGIPPGKSYRGTKIVPRRGRSALKFKVPIYKSKTNKKGITTHKKIGDEFVFFKSVVIPERQFLGWNQDMMEACETVIRDWILEQL